MNRKTMVAAIAVIVSLGGLALFYYSINNGNLPGTGEASSGEGLAVSISNITKNVSEYTLMKDYNGSKQLEYAAH